MSRGAVESLNKGVFEGFRGGNGVCGKLEGGFEVVMRTGRPGWQSSCDSGGRCRVLPTDFGS